LLDFSHLLHATNTMAKIPEIYIYILSSNAQASFTQQRTSEKFHKKGTGESTGDKIQATCT